jgi:hypothetical protein
MILATIILPLFLLQSGANPPPSIGPPPPSLVATLHLSPYYRKYVSAHGLPVLSSEKASDYALLEAAYLIDHMLEGRDDIRKAMIRNRVRFVVMAPTEVTTAVPEHSDLTPSKYWDKRARGLGATRARPVVSCGEENLLRYAGDPYAGENILVHEFGHAIHEMGLRTVEPDFDKRLSVAYNRAVAAGLWKGTYAATNAAEYWGEGVQSWFDCNQGVNAYHNGVRTREQLKAYDSELAELLASVFRGNDWRYQLPDLRADRAHLTGFDPSKAPRFSWDPALLEWYRKYEEEKKNGKP